MVAFTQALVGLMRMVWVQVRGLKVNIPLPPPHTGDDVYSMVIYEIIKPILDRYSPEFLVLQFGVDAHTGG